MTDQDDTREALSTPQILERLKARYSMEKGEWATLVEFERVDFLAVGCWASLKFAVHGHEVKTSRADWLAEIRKGPGKAAPGRRMSDYWWLAAGPGVLKDPDEVPPSWGILSVTPTGVRRIRPAIRLRPEAAWQGTVLGDEEGMAEDGGVDWETRRVFAMMARRQAYAQADAHALRQTLIEERGERFVDAALDRAATLTGRITSTARAKQYSTAAEQRVRRREDKVEADKIREITTARDEGIITPDEAQQRLSALWRSRIGHGRA